MSFCPPHRSSSDVMICIFIKRRWRVEIKMITWRKKMIHGDWMHRDYQSDLSLCVTWGNAHVASVIFLGNRYTLPNYERNRWQVQPSNPIARYVNEINSAFDDWHHCLIPAPRVCAQQEVEYSLQPWFPPSWSQSLNEIVYQEKWYMNQMMWWNFRFLPMTYCWLKHETEQICHLCKWFWLWWQSQLDSLSKSAHENAKWTWTKCEEMPNNKSRHISRFTGVIHHFKRRKMLCSIGGR